MRKKISIIGTGNVGASAAMYCLSKNLADVVLLDILGDMARGKALDLNHSASLENCNCRVMGTDDYRDTADSHIIAVTAGMIRQKGMTRDDLFKVNWDIVRDVTHNALKYSPNAILLVVTNPVDLLTYAILKDTDLPHHRVMGMSGILDASRLRYNVSAVLGIPAHAVHGTVIGEHGDSMVPLLRLASANGIQLTELLSKEQLDEIARKTVGGGAEVINLMGKSAWLGPGLAIARNIEAIIEDTKELLPCSVFLEGQYGARDMCMCVPVRLGGTGIEEIVELRLNDEESAAVARSVASIRGKLNAVGL